MREEEVMAFSPWIRYQKRYHQAISDKLLWNGTWHLCLFFSRPEIKKNYREYINPGHDEHEQKPSEDKTKGYLQKDDKPVNEYGRRK